jgi:5'-nucleotidase
MKVSLHRVPTARLRSSVSVSLFLASAVTLGQLGCGDDGGGDEPDASLPTADARPERDSSPDPDGNLPPTDGSPDPDGSLPPTDAGPGDPDAGAQPDAGPAPTVKVQVLAFNDLHGNLQPPSGSSGLIRTGTNPDNTPINVAAGGVTFFAQHIEALRATEPNTVVVSAGDLIGASPLLSALFHDEPTIEAMNMVGLDINAVGNHEFDEGTSELLRMQFGGCHPLDGCQDGNGFAGADFSFLAANVATGPGRTILPAYEIREFDGVKVAFIGMTLEGTPEIVTPVGVSGLTFRDEVETVNELVPELQAQGVRTIIVVLHEGGLQTGLYNECLGISGPVLDIVEGVDDEVDAFITGHTHQAYDCVIDGKTVTSAASFGRLITDIDLTIDGVTGEVIDIETSNVIVTRDVAPVAALQALLDAYQVLVAPLENREIGEVAGALTRPQSAPIPSGESTLGNVIADAQLAATRPVGLGGAEVAFMNPGGIRTDINAGPVTFGESFAVQPFGNSLVTLTLTGAQIERMLEQQFRPTGNPVILQVSAGFTYTFSASAPLGEKIDPAAIFLNGEVLDLEREYRVTVNSFLATGGDGFTVIAEGTDRLGGAVDLDALEDYLIANRPLAVPALDRVTVVP